MKVGLLWRCQVGEANVIFYPGSFHETRVLPGQTLLVRGLPWRCNQPASWFGPLPFNAALARAGPDGVVMITCTESVW